MNTARDTYQAAQAERQERERIAREKATQLSRPANEQVAADLVALQAATRAHMVERARRTGASADRLAQLEALTPAAPRTGNVVIDPVTMQPANTNTDDQED
ncbi:hypothetical protein [Ruania albidiflava]|uniref:hypothetical protein n=1 Tax=Ruania albidiflava TaxID=366586 RepID=UPI0012F99998|nr:hypothetical protein [Ruania albidiflava]